MEKAPNYLDPNTLASIASLELRARMIVEGMMSGMHRSPYFGYSVEFAQHRQYAPGDDLRHLDWKVFGRSDKLYLKQYQKETNLDLVIMVDISGSMAFGTDQGSKGNIAGAGPKGKGGWRKYDYAATLAATLAFLALRQQDRVGVLLFSDELKNATRTSNGRGHWRSIVDVLEEAKVEPIESDTSLVGVDPNDVEARATNMARMFDQVTARLNQRSLLVLISDLFDEPAALERGLARIRYRRHDLFCLHVLDHAELTFPFRSPSEFLGLEGEGRLPLDPASLRDAYLEVMNEHMDEVQQIMRKFGFDHLKLDTSEQVGPVLSHYLAKRAALVDKRK